MKLLCKCIAGLLVLSVMGLYFPRVMFGAGSGLFAKADKRTVTRHEPKIMSEPEKDIQVAEDKTAERKKPPWMLIGLGAAAVAALAAIAGGGGGGGGDGGGNGNQEGCIAISW